MLCLHVTFDMNPEKYELEKTVSKNKFLLMANSPFGLSKQSLRGVDIYTLGQKQSEKAPEFERLIII